MNKIIHGVIAGFFAFACWCLWGMLTLISQVMGRVSEHPPGFTQIIVGLRPLFVILPIVAATYCFFVWVRKPDSRHPWVPFFAGAMGILMLVTLPTMIAVWLPVIQFIELTAPPQ